MNDVQRIKGVNQADMQSAKIRKVEKPPEAGPIQDKLDISVTAVKAAEVARFTELAKVAPAVRPEVVQKAQERIAQGDYFKPEVTREIARKIVESL